MEISPLIGSVSTGYGSSAPELSYSETSQGLREASKEFVAVLFSQMFSAMRGNPDDNQDDEEGGSSSLFSGENVNMFMGFLDQEVSKKFSEQGGKDVVDALYHQLKGKNVFKDEKTATDKKADSSKVGNVASSIPAQAVLPLSKEGNIIEPSKKLE